MGSRYVFEAGRINSSELGKGIGRDHQMDFSMTKRSFLAFSLMTAEILR